MLGGYAGFFALWQLTREHLTKGQILWSALLILISLSFVMFEVYKMVSTQRDAMRQMAILTSSHAMSTPTKTLAALKNVHAAVEDNASAHIRLWGVSVFVSLAAGVGGALVMLCAFIAALLGR